MAQPQFMGREGRLALERRSKHVGTASIQLEVIDFQHAVNGDNVDRLVGLLQESRYDRMAVHNHAVATVDQQSLDLALRYSNLSAHMLVVNEAGIYPTLDFPPNIRLPCLHGADRLAAAGKFLPPGDKRWVVDLYLPDISPTLRSALVDAYSSEKEPHDGYFYAKIRHYQCTGDQYLEDTWWARLASISVQKKKNLARLLRNSEYRSAFNCQIDMPGLRGGMKLGTIHTMLSMRCDEECLRYLRYVKHIWSIILSQDTVAMERLDTSTVEEVELTAPGYCEQDAFHLKSKLQRGEIFGAFSSSEREKIWENMLSVSADRLIPSLRAFFDDVNYLQGPADCMKRLVSGTRGSWISRSFRSAFTGVNQKPDSYIVQTSGTQFESRPGNSSDQVEFGLRHMWIISMRDHREMPAQRKKLAGDRLARSELKEDETIFCAFGSLAYRLGFETNEIHKVMQRSADREIARNALLKARKPEHYLYDITEFNLYIDKIVSFFNAASKVSKTSSYNPGKGLPNRSGHPKELDHVEDQKVLFMDNLHRPVQDGCRGKTTRHVETTGGDYAHIEKMTVEEVLQERTQSGTTKPVKEPEVVIRNRQVQQDGAHRRAQEADRQAQEGSTRQTQQEAAELRRVQQTNIDAAQHIQQAEADAAQRVEKAEADAAQRIQQIEADAAQRIQQIEANAAECLKQAEADAAQRVEKAEADAAQRVEKAEADAAQRIQQIEANAAERLKQAEADAAQQIQKAKADAAAADVTQYLKWAGTNATKARHTTEVQADPAAAEPAAAEPHQVPEVEARRKVETEAQGVQQALPLDKLIGAQKPEKKQRVKHSGKETNRRQSETSERTGNLIQERRAVPLEQFQRSGSKSRVTRVSADESEAYETAREEKKDSVKKKNASPAGQDEPRALQQRKAALQTAHENNYQQEKRAQVQERGKIVLQSAKQDSEQSTSLQIAPQVLLGKQKRSTQIHLENVQAKGSSDASNVHTSKLQSMGKVIPQKRTKNYVTDSQKLARAKRQHLHEDKVTIKLMAKNDGEWVVADTIAASSHDTWFKGCGDKWELWDSVGRQLTEQTCFEDVIQDGTYEIHLVPREVDSSQWPNPFRLGTVNEQSIVRGKTVRGDIHLLKVD